jgi:DNA-binding protein YbaB
MDLTELGLDKELARALARFGLDKELARITSDVNALEEQLDAIAVTQVSTDRLVKATVDGRMGLRALALDPGIYAKQDADALAASILATVQRAAATAAAKSAAACDEFEERSDD